MKVFTLSASVLLLSMSAIAATSRAPERPRLTSLPAAELKAIYLECERLAAIVILDMETAANCSMVSEELLKRSFGGNFDEMLKWWRSTRRADQ